MVSSNIKELIGFSYFNFAVYASSRLNRFGYILTSAKKQSSSLSIKTGSIISFFFPVGSNCHWFGEVGKRQLEHRPFHATLPPSCSMDTISQVNSNILLTGLFITAGILNLSVSEGHIRSLTPIRP